MKVTKDGEHYKFSAETGNDKLKLTEFVQQFMPNTAASTPERPKLYYTEVDEAILLIGFPLYVVRFRGGSRYCQSDVVASEFIAELKDNAQMYSYLLYNSPTDVQQIAFWAPPPPAQK